MITIDIEKRIIKLLKTQGSKSVDELVDYFYNAYKISEREVKETILKLREKGEIKPDRQWKMKCIIEK